MYYKIKERGEKMNKKEIAQEIYENFINLNSQEKAFALMEIIESAFGSIGGDGFHYWLTNSLTQLDNEILEEIVENMTRRV